MINNRIQHIEQAIKRGCKPNDEIFHGAGPVSIAGATLQGFFTPPTYVLINDEELTSQVKFDPNYCTENVVLYSPPNTQRQYLAWKLGFLDKNCNVNSEILDSARNVCSYFNIFNVSKPWQLERIYTEMDNDFAIILSDPSLNSDQVRQTKVEFEVWKESREDALGNLLELKKLSQVTDQHIQEVLFQASRRQGAIISLNRIFLEKSGCVFLPGDRPKDDYIISPKAGYEAIVGIHFLSDEDHQDYNGLIERFRR